MKEEDGSGNVRLNDRLGVCQLTVEPFHQCCCKCENRHPVYYHCTTEPKPIEYETHGCVCGIQKGWACVICGRVYDNWREHSCGCECYHAKADA